MSFNRSTEFDSYHMIQDSDQMPALGHHFGPELVCDKLECEQTWEAQQQDPTICPNLITRLQGLEDLERALAQEKRANSTLRRELKLQDAKLALLREREVVIPTDKEAAKWLEDHK